jgi:hypothetical protein
MESPCRELGISCAQRGEHGCRRRAPWQHTADRSKGRQGAYILGNEVAPEGGFLHRLALLLQLIGLEWKVPDFSTLCRRQKMLAVGIESRRTVEPLHLLIDSTGIKVEGEGEWHSCRKQHDYQVPSHRDPNRPVGSEAKCGNDCGAIFDCFLHYQAESMR